MAEQIQAEIYYSPIDITILGDYFENFRNEFNRSQGDKLQILLQNCLINKSGIHNFSVNFLGDQSSIILSPIQSIHDFHQQKDIIFLSMGKSNKQHYLAVDTDKKEFNKIEIWFISNKEEAWKIINSKQKRVLSDLKHGDENKPAFKSNKGRPVSQLKCSLEEAQKLLESAICDLNHNNNLFVYDPVEDSYMEFFDENALNQFHGFHLSKEEWKRVPNSVKKYYGRE
ncbi:MAG TPA: hypothetical protein VF676_00510 [Flavobacterium sp.]